MMGEDDGVIGRLKHGPDREATLLFGVLFTAGVVTGEPLRPLKGPEIAATFTGMEFPDQVHIAEVFKRDGTLAAFSMGKRQTGKWRVASDELCLSHEGQEQRCYEVWMSGRNVELRQPGISLTENGVLQKPAAQHGPATPQ
jgi:hypothetical protein